MRTLAALLLLTSSAVSAPPYLVNAPHKYEVTTKVESQPPLCIKINGIDQDLDAILTTPSQLWTWPGMTESSLRRHLAVEHGVEEIETLTFSQIKKIHAVLHEREQKQKPAAPKQPAQRSGCPGGNCPQSAPRRRGLFFNW